MNNKSSGVYAIVNRINNKIYIGSAQNIELRFSKHRYDLRTNSNRPNKHLQASWNKYGEIAFLFQIVCLTDDIVLTRKIEEFLIKKYKTINNQFGYNKTIYAKGGMPGIRNLKLTGNLHPRAKLNKNDVLKIISYINEGFSSISIAKFFYVSEVTISDIKFGKNWKEFSHLIDNPVNSRIAKELKDKIRSLKNSNLSSREVGRQLNISHQSVLNTWRSA